MKILDQLLIVNSIERNAFQIILWWELRRILYNGIILIIGIVSMQIMYALVELKPGEDLQEPLAIIGFGFLCNLFYTIGWLTEIFSKKTLNYGPKNFKKGLYFTLFFCFPTSSITYYLLDRKRIRKNAYLKTKHNNG